MTKLYPQEIYLLERYSSVSYFRDLRDTWGAMVEHVEKALDSFMHDLPADYRNRQLPEQPDIVWGEQVLPNFRTTYKGLCDGVALLINNDFSGLSYCNGPLNDFIGQREFWSGWMSETDRQEYSRLLLASNLLARNISTTEKSYWKPGDLFPNFDEKSFGPCDLPNLMPNYRINRGITVSSGSPITVAGIYLPNIENSCAEFINIGYGKAPDALVYIRDDVLLHPTTKVPYASQRIYEKTSCVWTLVERDKTIVSMPKLVPEVSIRVLGGEICPKAGYYFSPAKSDSLRWFENGEIMPNFDTQYGLVIWQWDNSQSR